MKIVDMKLLFSSVSYRVVFWVLVILVIGITTVSAQKSYDHFFKLQKQILIDPVSVYPPLGNYSSITMNKNGDILIGFFPSQRGIVFDSTGKYLSTLCGKEEEGRKKITHFAPDPIYNEKLNRYIIADFFNIRVIFFDDDFKIERSFIANADNIRNILNVGVFNDKLLISGPAITYENTNPLKWFGEYLHVFSMEGKYIHSFFDPYPAVLEDNRYRNNACLFTIGNNRVYCTQSCHYEISIFDNEFKLLNTFGEKPKNWKRVIYSEKPSQEELRENRKHSRISNLFTVNGKIIYAYTTVDHETWQHLDYPRLCIYSMEGEKIADGITVDYGYNPKDYFCTTFGVNSTQDRLLIVKRENPEDENSNIIVGIFKPKWGE